MHRQRKNLAVAAKDYLGNFYLVRDAVKPVMRKRDTGAFELTYSLNRDPGLTWRDVGLNMQSLIIDNGLALVWHGRQEAIEQVFDEAGNGINITAQGYWSSLNDQTYNYTMGSGIKTPESQLAEVLQPTKAAPQIASTELASTGIGNVTFPFAPVPPSTAMKIVQDRIAIGSISGPVIAKVEANRKFKTRIKPATTDIRYIVRSTAGVKITLTRRLSDIYNRVDVGTGRTIDSSKIIAGSANDTVSQSQYAIDYDGTGTFTSLVREYFFDGEAKGMKADTQADFDAANALAAEVLNQLKAIPAVGSVEITQDYVIYDSYNSRYIRNYELEPGDRISFTKLVKRYSDAGTNPGQAISFYITESSYDFDTGYLRLSPEGGQDIANFI